MNTPEIIMIIFAAILFFGYMINRDSRRNMRIAVRGFLYDGCYFNGRVGVYNTITAAGGMPPLPGFRKKIRDYKEQYKQG